MNFQSTLQKSKIFCMPHDCTQFSFNQAYRVCHFKDYFWNQFYAIVTCTIFVMELSLRWIIDLKNNALLRAASVWYIRCSIKFVKFSMMATKILERNINRPVRFTGSYHLLAFEFRLHLHWTNRKVLFRNSIFTIIYLLLGTAVHRNHLK